VTAIITVEDEWRRKSWRLLRAEAVPISLRLPEVAAIGSTQ
jgi:hypothetical protein